MSSIADYNTDDFPQVDLTVVIVNYNVRYFLEQCLRSVLAASTTLRTEIYVVDNASTDTSAELAALFPAVHYIANHENVGFAKANNQAISKARGRYILLLNPDTLVPENCFSQCIAYMDAHPRVGNLGVRMIDGRGEYLPESKRGFPSAWVSFTKMSGLARLAPDSPRFNGYYLGHLDEHDTNEVDVLPGAFMFLRREALQAAGGGLDETYFMYGEDVDLSYTIAQAGYTNVYFPEVTVLHYKGESTRKRSWRYVRSFYEAMAIFSDKHVTGRNNSLRRLAVRSAIYLRATLALVVNAFSALLPTLIDAAAVVATLLLVKSLWSRYYFGVEDYFDESFYTVSVPLYSGLWVMGLALFRAYQRPLRIPSALRGLGFGTLCVLLAYALLPSDLRTSRAIILLTAGSLAGVLPVVRLCWSLLWPNEVSFSERKVGQYRRLAILGSLAEEDRCLSLLARSGIARNYVGRIDDDVVLQQAQSWQDTVQQLSLDELIVCTRDVTNAFFIELLEAIGGDVELRVLAHDASAIVGSPSPSSPGSPYSLTPDYALAQRSTWQRKRSTDQLIAVGIFLFLPLSLLSRRPLGLLRNAYEVLIGRLTWIGYAPQKSTVGLPKLDPCVLTASLADSQDNRAYAKHYSLRADLRQLRSAWRQLGSLPTRTASSPESEFSSVGS